MNKREISIREAKRYLIALHQIVRDGNGDSALSDDIRQHIGASMAGLSAVDKRRLNDFSSDLSSMDAEYFSYLVVQYDMDPRMVRIYWRFQYIRSDLRIQIREIVKKNYFLWEVGDRSLTFKVGENNTLQMLGYQPILCFNPTIRETKEAMIWLVDGIDIPISYPPIRF